ncbi:MAG: hypothetical protein U9O89_02460 [Thermoproteota archaeon]|nr:hypothetical protein [Thermoproteota archaeon]
MKISKKWLLIALVSVVIAVVTVYFLAKDIEYLSRLKTIGGHPPKQVVLQV